MLCTRRPQPLDQSAAPPPGRSPKEPSARGAGRLPSAGRPGSGPRAGVSPRTRGGGRWASWSRAISAATCASPGCGWGKGRGRQHHHRRRHRRAPRPSPARTPGPAGAGGPCQDRQQHEQRLRGLCDCLFRPPVRQSDRPTGGRALPSLPGRHRRHRGSDLQLPVARGNRPRLSWHGAGAATRFHGGPSQTIWSHSPMSDGVGGLSPNLQHLETSATIAISAEAKRRKAAGEDVIDLGAGEPDFPTPPLPAEAGIKAIKDGKTRYPANEGILELRAAAATHLSLLSGGRPVNADHIVVSTGSKQALFNTCFTLFGPGDVVAIPAPAWVSYPQIVHLTRARPVLVPGDLEWRSEEHTSELQSPTN